MIEPSMDRENGTSSATTTAAVVSPPPMVVSPPPMVNSPRQVLVERLKDYGHEDIFALWDELSPDETDFLVRDIENLDLPRIDRIRGLADPLSCLTFQGQR